MGSVYWDLDGTLTDPKKGITESIQFALRELGLPVPPADDLTWCIGPALLWSFERLGAPDPEAALAHYRAVYTTKGLYECTLYDGILEALGAIGADHPMHLATAKPHAYAKKITAHYGIAPHLTHEFGPELDGTRNDKGELLAHALGITGDDPAKSVMIGDRHYDMKAARDVGMRFIAVGWGYGGEDDLSSADAQVENARRVGGRCRVFDRLAITDATMKTGNALFRFQRDIKALWQACVLRHDRGQRDVHSCGFPVV